ncbi:hypothetical protein BaRGS_00028587 [Batillaria attramentaria]|uniref:Uncharacterized protein n=1 Tax=Batillaria attramentaria TaxID=370345 RepID=A0ABD0JYR2_9CAEN
MHARSRGPNASRPGQPNANLPPAALPQDIHGALQSVHVRRRPPPRGLPEVRVPETSQTQHTGHRDITTDVDLHPQDNEDETGGEVFDVEPWALVTNVSQYTEPPPPPAPSRAQGLRPRHIVGKHRGEPASWLYCGVETLPPEPSLRPKSQVRALQLQSVGRPVRPGGGNESDNGRRKTIGFVHVHA